MPFLTSEDDNVVGRHSSILDLRKQMFYELIRTMLVAGLLPISESYITDRTTHYSL